jgi:hypothetical protein
MRRTERKEGRRRRTEGKEGRRRIAQGRGKEGK